METTGPTPIVGVFRDRAKANRAIEDLKQAGFREDQIISTFYSPTPSQAAEVPENSRVIVTVNADGRDQQAFGILFDNGANNADLPPGMALKDSTIVSAEPETIDLVPEPTVEASFSSDSFFAEGKELGPSDGTEIMDNPNFPHG
jgi:hypothetical protein